MTDGVLILRKLAMLREHAARVRRRRPPTVQALEADVDLQDAIGLSLLVAIQEATDIAFHIVSDEGWGLPGSYAEGFEILARHGVIDTALAVELSRAVGLRNRIAHGYATIDLRRIWAELPAGLATLERYSTAIARFIPPTAG